VVLRGLTLKAATVGSGYGINHLSGTLFVENSVVDGWVIGLASQGAAQSLFVKGSVFRNQTDTGLYVGGGTAVTFAIDGSFFENNTFAGMGIYGGTGRISNTVVSRNQFGFAVANTGVVSTFQRCEAANNGWGIRAFSAATVRISGSTMVNNAFGVENWSNGATIESLGNNVIRGNGTDTVGTFTTVALQ
jgi:hypothetical protein